MAADINRTLFKKALFMLYREGYIGPENPKETWFASNAPGSGVLGTVSHVPAAKAFDKPAGVSHSIAEHTAHLAFALRTGLQYAKGNFTPVDWKTSWSAGEATEQRWAQLQAELRTALDALVAFGENEESFEQYESIAGFMGQMAHGAYHLGAIRQLTQLAGVQLPQEGSGVQAGQP